MIRLQVPKVPSRTLALGALVLLLALPSALAQGTPVPTPDELAEMSPETLDEIRDGVLEAAAEMPDQVMAEGMPGPVAVAQGQIQGVDRVHQGSGSATIYLLPGQAPLLCLEDLDVTNGPDLHVLLVENPEPGSRADIMAGYLDLGPLKGNRGNQNYEIPADIDLSEYGSVVIYCQPFHVIFATAPLN